MTTAPGEIKIKARLGDRVFSSSTIVAGSIILAVLAGGVSFLTIGRERKR